MWYKHIVIPHCYKYFMAVKVKEVFLSLTDIELVVDGDCGKK